jgi:hypothetical protein
MATVLIAAEMGAGFGHAWPLLQLARELAALGQRPVFALGNVVSGGALLRDQPFAVLQAPVYPRPADQPQTPFVASSHADILAVHGYHSPDTLQALVQSWQALLDLVRPVLILAEHSPTLCLAAHGVVPVLKLGGGFLLPPGEGAEFPPLIPDARPVMPQQQILEVVHEVQRRRGRPAPATLPALLSGDRFLTCLPQLDPYRALRREGHLGPLAPLPPPLPWPDEPRFFAYLSSDYSSVEIVLACLARTGHRGTVYLRGATADQRQRLRGEGLEVLDHPAPVAELLGRAAVVLSHGGVGLAQEALAAGRPQLILPGNLEQGVNARLLHEMGIALYFYGEYKAGEVSRGVKQLLTVPQVREQAAALARTVQQGGPWDALARVRERCLTLLHGLPQPGA